jgi:ubiquinone/menaquinone biosynthesis C-methylase UbiE
MGVAEQVYDYTAINYDLRSGNPYTERVRAVEAALIKKHASGRILDAGCGTGYHLRALDNVIGIDVSKRMVDLAKKTGRPVKRANVESLPFKDGEFDIVLCLYSVLNVCNWKGAIRELCRVAKPSGRIIISISSIYDKGYKGIEEKKSVRPDRYTQTKKMHIEGKKLWLHLFTKSELVKEFSKHRFEMVNFDSIFRGVVPHWGLWKKMSVWERFGFFLDRLRPREYGSFYFMVFKRINQ